MVEAYHEPSRGLLDILDVPSVCGAKISAALELGATSFWFVVFLFLQYIFVFLLDFEHTHCSQFLSARDALV